MSNIFHISYVIDGSDRIVFVGDDWSELAIAGGASELSAENVLNRCLWDFISDDTTREIYRHLTEKVRAGGSTVSFDLRCDSPDLLCFSEMSMTLLENKHIRFDSRIVNTERRTRQDVFPAQERRNPAVIVVCSWCKRVDMRDGRWQEIKEALPELKLFELPSVPQVSHGMCASCYESMLEKHDLIFDDESCISR